MGRPTTCRASLAAGLLVVRRRHWDWRRGHEACVRDRDSRGRILDAILVYEGFQRMFISSSKASHRIRYRTVAAMQRQRPADESALAASREYENCKTQVANNVDEHVWKVFNVSVVLDCWAYQQSSCGLKVDPWNGLEQQYRI